VTDTAEAITTEMLERRAQVKEYCRISGRDYAAAVKPYRLLNDAVRAETGCSALGAVLVLQQDLEEAGKSTPYVTGLLIAAALDGIDEARLLEQAHSLQEDAAWR